MGQTRIATDTELFVGKTSMLPPIVEGGPPIKEEMMPFPICGSVGGTKEHPIPIPGIEEDGYMMQEDNVTLEFNIPPSDNGLDFVEKVQTAMSRLGTFCKAKGLTIIKNPSATLTYPALLEEGAKSQFPGAFKIGCSPDYSAYAESPGSPREVPSLDAFSNDRFAGMHFHVSYDNPHKIPEWVFVRFIDLFVNMNVMTYDVQGRRRDFYGLAGLYRPTKYPDGSTGLEYRSHGNVLAFNPSLLNRVVTGILRTIEDVNLHPQEASAFFANVAWKDVATAIGEQDLKLAAEIYGFVCNNAKWHKHMGWLNRQDQMHPPTMAPRMALNLEAAARAVRRANGGLIR